MKHNIYRNILAAAFCSALLVLTVTGCRKDAFQEEKVLALTRCLMPTDLKASVSSSTGSTVTFQWNVSSEAESYDLRVYSDKAMETEALAKELKASEVPYITDLQADCTYYYKVQAKSSSLPSSKWASYVDSDGELKSIKTYAVKDNLFMKADTLGCDLIGFKWSSEVADCKDVDRIEYGPVGGSESEFKTYTVTQADKDACKATVTGLTASTQYVATLYYLTASRGEVTTWTLPDKSQLLEVSTAEALIQGIKSGASMMLKYSAEPYVICTDGKGVDIAAAGMKLCGETSADGKHAEIIGSFNIPDDFSGADIVFEGVTVNGNSVEGFAIQHKEGGTVSDVKVGRISYKNCDIKGFTKGLLYEWGKSLDIDELSYEACHISAINESGTGGGDGVDIRQATRIGKLVFRNSTIYNSFRTFLRVDSSEKIGDVEFDNNLVLNLCTVTNTNNAGLVGFQKAPTSFSLKKNVFLNMTGASTFTASNAKYKTASELNLTASDNRFFNYAETFFNDHASQSDLKATDLKADPCYNAKGGVFNFTDQSLKEDAVGPSEWWTAYAKQPEKLDMQAIEGNHTWNLADASLFTGTAKERIVRDNLMIVASEEMPVSFTDGSIAFAEASARTSKGAPTDQYLRFLVNKSGSILLNPASANGDAHLSVATCSPAESLKNPTEISVKGGVAPSSASTKAQKVVLKGIGEETMVVVYASGALNLSQIAWSTDTTDVNTAMATPVPSVSAASVKVGDATDIVVSWDAVDNAGSYTVALDGKTQGEVTDGCSYTLEGKVVKMLSEGSHMVKVYANPAEGDIYNTMSEAGCVSFAIQPAGGGGGETEFVVSSVQELNDAIAAGKVDITLAYNSAPYELGTLALTSPLRLKGQASDGSYPTVKGSVTLSGEIGGSVIFTNINFEGTGTTESIIKETAAVTADTVAVIGGVIRNYSKALYDNSGKYVSSVQYLIFDNIQVYDCSEGSDFIDMRAGAYHNLQVTGSTFARSARTFIRTDAANEINNVLVRNNTFYKVCTNSTSKDNNGLFHIRGTGGSGILQYKIQNNLFYSILINEAPGNTNGYPKFISKNAAAIKPSAIMNNYFYNIQEDGDYSWWTVNCSKEEGTAGGGCVLPADPCKDVAKDDFTLTNGVAMNAGVGDPRWNPAGGGTPTSEITVDNATDFLSAISAGKKTITLSEGTYDLTAITEMEGLTGGVLSISNDLSLIGSGSVTFIGGFKPTGDAIRKFSATGIDFAGNGTIGNFIDVADASVAMSSISLKNGGISNYMNRMYSQSMASTLSSLVIDGIQSSKMGTGGDCIDVRKGTVSSIKVTNSTFANGIRTFLRVDQAAVCNAITVKNNTFYNLCAVDSKDNNGIMHVRSTTLSADSTACRVENNLFASMHREAAAPTQTNGFPKLVSTSSQKIFEPCFNHNYYYDFDTDEGYSWWNTLREGQTAGCRGYGVVLASNPFLDAANGDFTLTDALAMSENIGDPRWNPSKGDRPGDSFAVSSVEDMLSAIAAGKTSLSLAYGTYDLTAAVSEGLSAGILSLSTSLTLTGKPGDGKYPELVGGFKLTGANVDFNAENISFNGNAKNLGYILEVLDGAFLNGITLKNCNVSAYSKGILYGAKSIAFNIGNIDLNGLLVSDIGTSGDFLDLRSGTAAVVKITNSTFYNGIRTFLRLDAAVTCGSVLVKNNTFYNMCSADSKDNNGIIHVQSSTLSADKVKVEKNIFASMHREIVAPTQASGFPKLVSTKSQAVFEPTFIGNLYFDIETDEGYSWWNTLSAGEATGTADGGAVLTETPFSGDPAAGKFTVKAAYKGYGDLRW